MSTFAIGDLQGCYRPFMRLLEGIDFDPEKDRLWLVGDLVNRGDGSLECLRFVQGLGGAAITVLGNHDLNLLALAEKPDALAHANDTLQPILRAPDCDELLAWLRQQPLMHRDTELGWTMVHAGLAPQWSIDSALTYAGEVETILRGDNYRQFLATMYGNTPDHWRDDLAGADRLRVITNYLTRTRLCYADGRLNMEHNGKLEDAPPQLTPWFALPSRASADERIVFGHWSALEQTAWPEHNVWGVDTGCVWGNALTTLRLDCDPPKMTSVDCTPSRC